LFLRVVGAWYEGTRLFSGHPIQDSVMGVGEIGSPHGRGAKREHQATEQYGPWQTDLRVARKSRNAGMRLCHSVTSLFAACTAAYNEHTECFLWVS
jgi:hypothetical protein